MHYQLLYSGSMVCQPLDCINVCRVKSGQTAIQLCQRTKVKTTLSGSHHRRTGHMSLLDAISFNRCHNGPAIHHRNDSAETTVVQEGKS